MSTSPPLPPEPNPAGQALQEARRALRHGDRRAARRWAEQAAARDPSLEEAWLILAALASPRASVLYLRRALEINPRSVRARQGMHWAIQRVRVNPPRSSAPTPESAPTRPVAAAPRLPATAAIPRPRAASRMRLFLLILLLLIVAGAFVTLRQPAAFSWLAQVSPAIAAGLASPTPSPLPPTATPSPMPTATPTPTMTPSPTASLTPEPSATPTEEPTSTEEPRPTRTPRPKRTKTPTPEPASVNLPEGVVKGERWIDVDLSEQRLYAYQGKNLENEFLVSTGTWLHPTVTGQYHIYVKYRYSDMAGPGYYLPNVPYTMYFYDGYGIHGTYWHNNFGTPMSHGCVNLQTDNAAWLFDWASVGTLVNIHP